MDREHSATAKGPSLVLALNALMSNAASLHRVTLANQSARDTRIIVQIVQPESVANQCLTAAPTFPIPAL